MAKTLMGMMERMPKLLCPLILATRADLLYPGSRTQNRKWRSHCYLRWIDIHSIRHESLAPNPPHRSLLFVGLASRRPNHPLYCLHRRQFGGCLVLDQDRSLVRRRRVPTRVQNSTKAASGLEPVAEPPRFHLTERTLRHLITFRLSLAQTDSLRLNWL